MAGSGGLVPRGSALALADGLCATCDVAFEAAVSDLPMGLPRGG